MIGQHRGLCAAVLPGFLRLITGLLLKQGGKIGGMIMNNIEIRTLLMTRYFRKLLDF